MILAAKNAKVAKIGGRGLEAFALSAFFAAKSENGNARQVQRTVALVSWRVNI